MAELNHIGPGPARRLPRETPVWLRVPADFSKAARTVAGTGNASSSSSGSAEASQPLQERSVPRVTAEEPVSKRWSYRRMWRDSKTSSTVEVLAFKCDDGPRLEAYSREADTFLQHFFAEPLSIQYADDAHWERFQDVGAALRLVATKEECMCGAFCEVQNAWAFGIGMGTTNRYTVAKIALSLTMAFQVGIRNEKLMRYSQLASLVLRARQKPCVRKRIPLVSAALDTLASLPRRCRFGISSWFIGKQLCISSPCEGSGKTWAQLKMRRGQTNGQTNVSWDGFCVCCKRPLSLSLGEVPVEVPVKRRRLERCAYVCAVWGQDPQFVLGAMVLGYSLRRTGTRHDLIVMYTSDVPAACLTFLRRAGWHLHQIEYVEASEALFANPHNRFKGVFTKLRVFELVEYSKVLLLDSDLLVRENIDCLFELPAPAAMHRGVMVGYTHGEKIDGQHFFGGARPGLDMHSSSSSVWDDVVKGPWSWGQAGGINAGVMLLRPDLETLHQCLSEVFDGMHPEHIRGGGPEQDYLSRFYANDWTHISVAYNFQLHQMYFMLGNVGVPGMPTADRKEFLLEPDLVKVFHYSSDPKPWMRRLEARFSGLSDAAWLSEVLGSFGGYRAYVLKDPEDVRWCQAAELDVPSWAVEAAENVTRLALRVWEQAYEELASELCEPRLAHAVIAASGHSGWLMATLPHSRANPTWDIPWEQLSVAQRQAASHLGWNAESWDSHFWVLGREEVTKWSDLSVETRSSLEALGETAESWDCWESNRV